METFGRYELRRRLGVGGMAEVYEAIAFVAEGVEKSLVIKRILEEHSRDPRFRSMFVDEARVALRLNHPNVVQVFDFGKVDDRYFLAMELVRGKDLGAILARAKQQDRTLPAGVALFIAGEAAKGLDHAHRLTGLDGKTVGLVHRDVSPQNVLVSNEGAVKIGDFGIAKFNSREGNTQAATVRGKVRYLSPEQAEGLPLDARSDLFSLGVVLYEMVTGTHAFDGKSDYEVLTAVRRAKPVPASHRVKVPPDLERVLARAMARDAKDRYARGNDLQRDLEDLAAKEGLRASSGSLAEFIASIFPENARVSDEHGETVIRRLPERGADDSIAPIAERTQIRRMPDEADGLKVFVSSEIPLEYSESATRATNIEHTASENIEPTREGRATIAEDHATFVPPTVPARSKGRSEATLARMPSPPLDPADEEPTDIRHPEPIAPAAVTEKKEKAAPIGAVHVERGPAVVPVERRSIRAKPTGAQTAPLTAAAVLLALGLVFLLLRGTHWGRALFGSEEAITMPQLSASGPPGFLALTGKDGDAVSIDGITVGSLPLPAIALSAGLHSVTVAGPEKRVDFAVNIDVGETEEKHLDTTPPVSHGG